jgi:hypothetical protein
MIQHHDLGSDITFVDFQDAITDFAIGAKNS